MNGDVKAANVTRRLSALSPAKREMLERLLARDRKDQTAVDHGAQDAAHGSGSAISADIRPDRIDAAGGSAAIKSFYELVNRNLNSTGFAQYSTFLNFGYVPNDSPRHAVVTLPAHCLNKTCVDLVLELIADTPVDGRAVLDVGCGRGGTVSVFCEYFSPRRVVGLDLSGEAVAFCRRVHRFPHVGFVNGDAQRLPFADRTFGVISNVESSCTYPDVEQFYREVHRVLEPAGAFVYTDYFTRTQLPGTLALLREIGFLVDVERDITKNVLLSRDETAATHMATFAGENDAGIMQNFLGTPDSPIYRELREGRASYAMFRLTKSAVKG